MVSPELTPLQQVYQEIPERWYEQYDPANKCVNLISNIVFVSSVLASTALIISGNDNLVYHFIGASSYLTQN